MNGSCSSNQTGSVTLPINCLWGTSSTSCSLCDYGFTLTNGFCYPTITLTTQDINCTVKLT
jgi:hypothetical protein